MLAPDPAEVEIEDQHPPRSRHARLFRTRRNLTGAVRNCVPIIGALELAHCHLLRFAVFGHREILGLQPFHRVSARIAHLDRSQDQARFGAEGCHVRLLPGRQRDGQQRQHTRADQNRTSIPSFTERIALAATARPNMTLPSVASQRVKVG